MLQAWVQKRYLLNRPQHQLGQHSAVRCFIMTSCNNSSRASLALLCAKQTPNKGESHLLFSFNKQLKEYSQLWLCWSIFVTLEESANILATKTFSRRQRTTKHMISKALNNTYTIFNKKNVTRPNARPSTNLLFIFLRLKLSRTLNKRIKRRGRLSQVSLCYICLSRAKSWSFLLSL